MTAWMASEARSTAGDTSKEVLAARCLGRRLGNPLASLLSTLRAADRLLSAATAVPELAGEDPFATLRALLQSSTTRLPEQLQRGGPRGSNSVAERRVPVRNAGTHSRRSDLPSGSEHVSAGRRAGSRGALTAVPAVGSANPRPAPAPAPLLKQPSASTAVAAGRPQPTVANGSDALAQRRRRLRGALGAIGNSVTGAHPVAAAESIVNPQSAVCDAALSVGESTPVAEQAAYAGRDATPATHTLLDARNGDAVATLGDTDTSLTSPDSELPRLSARSALARGTTAAQHREMSALLAAPLTRTMSPSAHTASAAVTSPGQASVSSNRTLTRELPRARTQAAVLPDTPVDTVLETAYRNGVDLS